MLYYFIQKLFNSSLSEFLATSCSLIYDFNLFSLLQRSNYLTDDPPVFQFYLTRIKLLIYIILIY